MNINADISKIHDVLRDLEEKPYSKGGIHELNSNIHSILSKVKLDISQIYEDNFLIRRDMAGTLAELRHTINKLSDSISKLKLPEEEKGIHDSLQNKIKKTIDIFNIVAKGGVKGDFDPFTSGETQDFYITYSYRDFLRGKVWRPIVENQINWQECVRDAQAHPEWPIFKQEMKKLIGDEKVIGTLWQLTVEGIDFQRDLNAKGQKHSQNPHYEQLANLLDEHGLLNVKPGESLALWSGGYLVSLFAQKSQNTTVEKTAAGRIFHNLVLYPHWGAIGPLWNCLSVNFCKHAAGTVHVYLRIQDPQSVLERKELSEITRNKDVSKISFHPLLTKGSEARDVLDLEVVPLLYSTSTHPKVQLKDVLVETCKLYARDNTRFKGVFDANIKAIKKMKLE